MFDFASRIAKLDAVSLDKEFLSFLKREITGLLSTVTNEAHLSKFTPEITLLVKFLVWKFTISSSGSTIGQKLLGIKYASLPGKLKLLFVLEAVIPYLIERLDSIRESPTLNEIRRPLKRAEKLFKVLHVVNFCMFLVQNRYPTVASRVLGLPMVPTSLRFGPSAGYSYQIRELLWHQFADLLISILPMVNFQSLTRTVMKWIGGSGEASSTATASGSTNTNRNGDTSGTSTSPEDGDNSGVLTCSVCLEDAVIPQKVGTECFCYFCYQAFIQERF